MREQGVDSARLERVADPRVEIAGERRSARRARRLERRVCELLAFEQIGPGERDGCHRDSVPFSRPRP